METAVGEDGQDLAAEVHRAECAEFRLEKEESSIQGKGDPEEGGWHGGF